ncbi:MAG: citrate (Si)-synthase [Bacteriodetes bacterium]|nr:citrate (Si)-synthase [Bacteroidota bacterium]
MEFIKNKLAEVLPAVREKRTTLLKDKGEVQIAGVTVEQVIGGMRGIPSVLCDTSSVSADEGLRIRNIPIMELTDQTPEEIFFLLVTGSKPNDAERAQLKTLFSAHAEVPEYVINVLKTMHKDSHPMAMLSTALLAMEHESAFRQAYENGAGKEKLWEATLEDSIMLLSRITGIAAAIYRLKFKDGVLIQPDPNADWSTNFANMLGISNDAAWMELVRLYLVLHSDHEGGNVSAMTGLTVGSALSDVFYAVSAGLNGLAGPLHGLANQEVLHFILEVQQHFNGVPSDEALTQYCWDRLNSGRVIPGYGHGVLRVTDPRFTAFHKFADDHNLTNDSISIVKAMFRIVPGVLTEQGKAKSPWPNVDSISGSLLYDFGMTEFSFYTVMFGVSRAMGICSQILFHRMVGSAITRPKSLTLDQLVAAANK